MRRFISICLTIIIAIGILCSFVSCAGKQTEDTVSVGDYLISLCKTFGMDSYNSDVPYATTVKKDSEYFDVVQVAFEWEVISDENINVDENVTKAFLSETLVRCVDIENLKDMTEKDIHKLASEKDYISFSYDGEFSFSRAASSIEIQDSLKKSFDKWTNREYERQEDIKLSDNVVDVASAGATASDIIYDDANNTIAIPKEYVSNLSSGDLFAVPNSKSIQSSGVINRDSTNNSENDSNKNEASNDIADNLKNEKVATLNPNAVYKAEKVDSVDGYVIIHKSDDIGEDPVIEELDYQSSITPDLSKATIYDNEGNVIKSGMTNVSSFEKPSVSFADKTENDVCESTNTGIGDFSKSITIDLGDGKKITFDLTVGSDNISVKAMENFPKTNIDGVEHTGSISISRSFTNIKFDQECKYSFWGGLKYAYYGMSYTDTKTFNAKYGITPLNHQLVIGKGNTSIAGILNSEFKNTINQKAEKTFTLCSVTLAEAGISQITFDVRIKLSFNGSIEIVLETKNKQGFEYKNKNLRFIGERESTEDINIKAKGEFTVYFGLNVEILHCINLVGVGLTAGVGFEAEYIVHIANPKTKTEIYSGSVNGSADIADQLCITFTMESGMKMYNCFDLRIYKILRVGLDSSSVVGKLIKNREHNFYEGDSATIKQWHWEDGREVPECTRHFQGNEEETEDQVETESVSVREDALVNGTLDIDSYAMTLSPGRKTKINVVSFPSEQAKSALKFSSSDENVVKVDSNGNITAVANGNATITVSTSDNRGKYEVKCSVYVSSKIRLP